MITNLKIIKEYRICRRKDDLRRTATIIFVDDKFVRCEFTTVENPYDLNDWEWMAEISSYIKNIINQEARRGEGKDS